MVPHLLWDRFLKHRKKCTHGCLGQGLRAFWFKMLVVTPLLLVPFSLGLVCTDALVAFVSGGKFTYGSLSLCTVSLGEKPFFQVDYFC